MSSLNGKVALVTGASRGIGRTIAITFARWGILVGVNYRAQKAEAQKTLDQITSAGGRGMLIQADVSQGAEVKRLVAEVEEHLGPIAILVNNAAIAPHQNIEDITEQDWDRVMENNLKSVFLVTQAVLPGMRRRRWGRIINLSSGAVLTGGVVGIHYTTSKGGIEALTRAYALRLVKEGITVNNVAPALIETDMTRDPERLKKMIPMGRLGRTEEVAQAALLSVQNEFMTGQTIHVNGGLYFH